MSIFNVLWIMFINRTIHEKWFTHYLYLDSTIMGQTTMKYWENKVHWEQNVVMNV